MAPILVSNDADFNLITAARSAKSAAAILAVAPTEQRTAALQTMARLLGDSKDEVIKANNADVEAARNAGLPTAKIERLTLNNNRLFSMIDGLTQVSLLNDPIGDIIDGWTRPNGLQISKVRVPLGLIGIIYESRPNVTVDAAALCIKSGNAVILRGGSESLRSNVALADCLRTALVSTGLPADSVTFVKSTDRSLVAEMARLNGIIDCIIPRGGAGLIKTVIESATVPVIETGTGNCHIFVDKSADLVMATEIIVNAKVQRPSVCNSVETILVHKEIADKYVAHISKVLIENGVEVRGDDYFQQLALGVKPAIDEDWFEEYSDLIIAAKVVDNIDSAIAHINNYGTHHSEAIITSDYAAAQQFVGSVDSAAVYVNASTRFTDGFEFGFGAEIGISNQKLHARGPMGLAELTTYKYIVRGSGQIRS
jgi:glutamate-5-semialdehyde dehydrogenase